MSFKKAAVFGTAAMLAVILAACGPVGTSDSAILVISMSPGLETRTIEPGISMEVHHYVVSGDGPEDAGFEELDVRPGDTLVLRSLPPGEWTITVRAFNRSADVSPPGDLIGWGRDSVFLAAGELTPLTVTVDPVIGFGTIDIGVSWPDDVLTNPTVTGLLVPSGTSPDPDIHRIQFEPESVPGSRAGMRHTDTEVANGYYTLILTLTDGDGSRLWGTVEAVRIITDEISDEDFKLVKDVNRGGMQVAIEDDLRNPVTITFDVAEEGTQIPAGSGITVSATTSEPVDAYQWYLNGSLRDSTSNTIAVSDTLAPGYYTLDLVVETADGILSSGGISFEVLAIGTIQGPTFDPPGAGTVTLGGDIVSRGEGRGFEFTGYDLAATSLLLWGPDVSDPPGLAFDGAIDEAGETLLFDAAASDPANGILRFTGEAEIRYYLIPSETLTYETLPTRLTLTVSDASGEAMAMKAPTVYGISEAVGGVVEVTGDFSAMVLIESFYAGAWTPSVEVFDALHTVPADEDKVISSFTGAFDYIP